MRRQPKIRKKFRGPQISIGAPGLPNKKSKPSSERRGLRQKIALAPKSDKDRFPTGKYSKAEYLPDVNFGDWDVV